MRKYATSAWQDVTDFRPVVNSSLSTLSTCVLFINCGQAALYIKFIALFSRANLFNTYKLRWIVYLISKGDLSYVILPLV